MWSKGEKPRKPQQPDLWLNRQRGRAVGSYLGWEQVLPGHIPLGPWFFAGGNPRPWGFELSTAEGDLLQLRYDKYPPV